MREYTNAEEIILLNQEWGALLYNSMIRHLSHWLVYSEGYPADASFSSDWAICCQERSAYRYRKARIAMGLEK